MKGGLAVMLAALRSIEASAAAATVGYEVVINSDEEVGSPGSAALIASSARGKRAALTYEPSALPDGTLAGPRPGSGNFSISIRGRSAHAGRNPEDGRNAIIAAADLALRLARAKGPRLSVNPARIEGGSPNNVVPDHAVLRVNMRPVTIEDQQRGQSALDAAVAMVAAEHEVTMEIHGGFGRPPKPLDPAAERLFELVQRCGADLGQHIGWQPSGGVCDGNNIAACGVPVVDTMGVRGGGHPLAAGISDRRQPGGTGPAFRPYHPASRFWSLRVSFRVRPATSADFPAIYEMAKLTGGGFTNLPPDRGSLVDKLIRTEKAFQVDLDEQRDDLFMMVLENVETGQVRGTCQIFGMVGSEWPFYSYRRSTLTQTSKALGKTFRNETLTLCTDFEGSSEVGGLFLHPGERAGGLGMLLARSRYLFIRQHRRRFGDRVLAELRGVIDESGASPFWDAIAGRFFGMDFREADEFNAIHGTQFIADLMPRTPIYTAMLPESARSVMGVPHPCRDAACDEDAGARRLQLHDCYVDIFDGGPDHRRSRPTRSGRARFAGSSLLSTA
jgi:arginine/ornithine succinyltransferase subunit-like protein